jgi:molybdopterin molybdotransferase
LLASVGCTKPLVSPRPQVLHFTTGDEIVSPSQTPKPGQVRDSNTILIEALLEKSGCEVVHKHLPENFEAAQRLIEASRLDPSAFNLMLVSGGASVGDLDFTRPLLQWFGFEIVFNRVNLRPGAPLIFAANGERIAFGLPGNPVSHFVCLHLFVAAAIAKLTGSEPPQFFCGRLVSALDDSPNPRETLWPARGDWSSGSALLTPLTWSSSGDVKCLAAANALIRLPPKQGPLAAGTTVEFLPTNH